MKVLIFGPSGSGKTYLSQALRELGVNAYDTDEIAGLSGWYDRHGKRAASPKNADEALMNQYSFLWSRKFLENFLKQFSEVYLFGGSGNVFNVFDLFDKIYFLQIEKELQKERLLHRSSGNPAMDTNENGVVTWGDWLEEEAGKHGVPFIDATLTPEQIFAIISG